MDYYCGLKIYNHIENDKRKIFLFISVFTNISLLAFFKYYHFFIDNAVAFFSYLNFHPNMPALKVILPIGISFYTLQKMTYAIDIYRNEMRPTKNFISFALFVSFFPQLIAGPIERAKRIIPQFEKYRIFNKEQFVNGIQLIFWGLFKKVFVADNLAIIVDRIYGNPQSSGIEYVIATWAFAFQLYGDFSGYSDMARGAAKCMGIEIMENFKAPYFSINPSDFWRRWHISLSSWLRDYLYISMGGSRKGNYNTYRNLIVTMLLSGLWHGAAWNYVLWGAYHGVLLTLHRLYTKIKIRVLNPSSAISLLSLYFVKSLIFFQVICFGWIFFRSSSLAQISSVVSKMFNISIFSNEWFPLLRETAIFIFIPLAAMAIETVKEIRPVWFKQNLINIGFIYSGQSIYYKSIIYGILVYLICLYGASAKTFIYSQF